MADEKMTPVAGAVPPQGTPSVVRPATLKLKPILRKPGADGAGVARPMPHLPVKPVTAASTAEAEKPAEAPSVMEQLKGMTQKLKGVTQELPQQAILHKTGIIASQEMTEAQKMASKARTARISLSDAIGVAPVKSEPAPMKTIRIKRPVDLPAPAPAAPVASAATESASAVDQTKVAAAEVSVTQRKTLKISRPGAKFGAQKTVMSKRPAGVAPSAAAAAGKKEDEAPAAEVADIPEMPAVAPLAAAPTGSTVPDVPKGVAIMGIILQIAACVVMGALGYYLYNDMQLPLFCGGCM